MFVDAELSEQVDCSGHECHFVRIRFAEFEMRASRAAGHSPELSLNCVVDQSLSIPKAQVLWIRELGHTILDEVGLHSFGDFDGIDLLLDSEVVVEFRESLVVEWFLFLYLVFHQVVELCPFLLLCNVLVFELGLYHFFFFCLLIV